MIQFAEHSGHNSGRFWAMVYGAEPKANFTASEGAEQAPRVTF
jgi:hypothetical protein